MHSLNMIGFNQLFLIDQTNYNYAELHVTLIRTYLFVDQLLIERK